MVPLDGAVVNFFRRSIVTNMSLSAAVWPQFATLYVPEIIVISQIM